jgi:autotransporter-associated beta strand protein
MLGPVQRQACAASTTWNAGLANNNWSTGSNWTAGEPTSNADAIFPSVITGSANPSLSSNEVANSLTFQNSYTLSGGNLSLNSGGIFTDTGTSPSIASTLSAVGGLGMNGLTKTGTGTLTLSGTNTFQGAVAINVGVLSINADACLGASANAVTINGGALRTSASFSTLRAITLGGSGGTITASAGTLTLSTAFVANGNALTCDGAGVLLLSAASSRSGATTISNGTVRLAAAAALGSGAVTVNSNGIFELFGGVSGAQVLALNNGSRLRVRSGSSVYGGTMTVAAASSVTLDAVGALDVLTIGDGFSDYTGGSGATTIIGGAGTVSVPLGNFTYSGGWQVDSGTLSIANSDSLGTGTSGFPSPESC